MKQAVLFLIFAYQQIFPIRGHCRFYPTCSAYAKEAVERYGVRIGMGKALLRIARCNPFGSFGIDLLYKKE